MNGDACDALLRLVNRWCRQEVNGREMNNLNVSNQAHTVLSFCQ